MKKIKNFMLPEHFNKIYKVEASSTMALAREITEKLNELIDEFNTLNESDVLWKQDQEGRIRKGILYMKDNLINTLHDLLKIYDNDSIKTAMLEIYGQELNNLKVFATPQMFGAVGDGVTNDIEAIVKAIDSLEEGGVLYFPKGTYLMSGYEV